MARLALYLFGPFNIRLDGEEIPAFESDKVRALLAFLAVEADIPHRREKLAGLLWPDKAEGKARASLSQALYSLRRTLGGPGRAATHLLTTPETVQLCSNESTWLDVAEFKRLLASCEQHSHRPHTACQACKEKLEQANALYRGEFLADLSLKDSFAFDEWAAVMREQLRVQAQRALQRLAGYCEQLGGCDQALEVAWRLVEMDPLWEEGVRQLMALLARQGQRSAALGQYERLRLGLQQELGVEPERDTSLLAERLRKEDSPQAVPNNLPTFMTPFIGRQAERTALQDCLRDPNCRLITVLGPGGSGKTRLAIEAARASLDNFPDGVYLALLNPLQSVEALPAALVEALGVPVQAVSETKTQLLNYLRSKHVLLVMDGYEGILEGAGLAADILHAASGCKILATSRARLGVKGENVYPLEGLDYPPAGEEHVVTGYSAVQLFLEGARRVNPGSDPNRADLGSVAEICRLTQGMPLGVLLASAWSGIYTPQEIAAEINTSLDFLSAEWKDTPPRQRSLRASFEYSWGLLNENEKTILAGLSVFHGGFTRQAAQAVTGTNPHELLALVDKSLVQRSFEGRYQLHELIRQFAGDKLTTQTEHSRQAQTLHSRFYLKALIGWGTELLSSRQRQALEDMDREVENLRAAWRWAVTIQDWQDIAEALEGMVWYADLRLRFAEGERACRLALEKIPSQSFVHLASTLTIWQAHFLWRLNQTDTARKLLQDEFDRIGVLQAQGNDLRAEQAQALYELGELHMYSDRETAKGYYVRSLALFDELNSPRGQALVLASLGEAFHHTGPLDQAQIFLERGVGLCRSLGDPRLLARCLLWCGWNHLRQGNFTEADTLIHESIEMNRTIGDRYAEAFWSAELGTAKGWMGHIQEGCELISYSIPIYKELGLKQEMTLSILRRGLFENNLMEFQQARQDFQDCISLSYEINYQRGIGLGIFGMGAIMQNGGDFQEAEKLFLQAIPILQDVQADEVGWCLALLVITLRQMGQTARAWEFARQALDLAIRAHVFHTAAMTMLGIASLLIDDGQIEQAIELYELTQRNPLIKNSPWFYTMGGQYVVTAAASLPAEVSEAARARGRASDLFATAAELLRELSGETAIL